MKTISEPIAGEELQKLANEIGGFFIKVVIDLDKNILCVGAKMHVEEEEDLIKNGSLKENLWGGGYNLEEKIITYDSIINNKPGINNSSEILDQSIRSKLELLTRKLLNV